MQNNRLYYQVRPYLPWRLRIALRRVVTQRKRQVSEDVWPIDYPAARKPDGWPGWPDKKQFAVVLTHDVEGQKGLDKCKQLMELEAKRGFRSSFNFIPEGPYTAE